MPRLCLCKFVARKLGFARHHFHLIIVFSRKSFTMIHKAKPNAVKPRPRVTPMQRGSIIAYLKCGIRVESIRKETGVNRASVYRALKTWKSGPCTKTKNKKIGRPHKTTPEQDNFIVETVDKHRKLVPRAVQRMLFEIYGVRLSLSRIRH